MQGSDLRVEATRGDLVESVHPVHAAVVHADGRLLAAAGNPALVTWWRSAAKPFQALPLLLDGAADALDVTDEEVALACGSHSSEPKHLEVVSGFMERIGVADEDLACGIHTPLSPAVARDVVRGTVAMTTRWSNCSGKHTGMLALARYRGWPLQGYNATGHPVQQRIESEVARWTDVDVDGLHRAPDGCTAVCFGLPVRAMALAFARLGASEQPAARRITRAMMTHPFLVAGTGRLCTDLMAAWPGEIVAKIGAEGIYSATIPGLNIGLALKVEDGDMKASGLALLELLRQVLRHLDPERLAAFPEEALTAHDRQPIRNTRGVITGELRATGGVRFFDA